MPRRVLVLGGTRQARELAGRLIGDGFDVVSSLAGVTAMPVLPPGVVRTGGFGGVAGLKEYLCAEEIDVVVDATHAFAARMAANAAEACGACGVPLVRLEQPAWETGEGDAWWDVADMAAAVARLSSGARAFVAVGRKEVGLFTIRDDVGIVARMIEPPGFAVPESWEIVLARPPFTLEQEVSVLQDEAITVLVSKNAGGARPAKLDAARELGLPVIMVARPDKPEAATYGTIEEAAAAVAEV